MAEQVRPPSLWPKVALVVLAVLGALWLVQLVVGALWGVMKLALIAAVVIGVVMAMSRRDPR